MSGTPTAGALAARLALDTSGFNASMAASGQISERELKRIQRQVRFVSDYIKEMGQQQKTANDSASMAKATSEMVRYGQAAELSSKQLMRANQMLPAQMTDIVTSLAAGQQPWLVLIQQGGQIKDMYGGIGNALRQMVAMVSPARLAIGGLAAVTAAVGYEMLQGSERAAEFQKQLALTGNAAGLTEASLRELAIAQAALTKRSVLDSRDTVTAAAATGRFGPGALEEVSRAMAAYQRLTGETAEKAAQHFAKMADGATKWAAEENKVRHFLTLEIYRQIAALEDQDKKQAALALTARAWYENVEQKQLPQLGYLATAWKTWGVWIDAVRDKLRNVGAPSTIADDFTRAQARLELAKKAVESAERNAAAGMTAARPQDARRELQLAQQAFNQAEARLKLEQAGAKASAELAAREEERVKKEAERREAAKRAKPDKNKDFVGPPTFDEMYPKANVSAILAEQRDNQSAARLMFENERAAYADIAAAERKQRLDDMAQDAAATKKLMEDMARDGQAQVKLFEDSVMNLVRNGKDGFRDLFTFMAEEFLRNQIRMAGQKYLLDEKGAFLGWGQGAMNFLGAIGGFLGFPKATGMDYVPYDGYPAILHEGEKVMTKAEASYERSGGRGGMVFDFSVKSMSIGQGVSRAEMAAALSQQASATEARMRRLSAQGAFS